MSCCAATVCSPDMIEQTADTQRKLEDTRIIAGSVDLGEGKYKTDFIVPDMHCVGCIGKIERGLAEVKAVSQVRANLTLKTVSVVWDSNVGQASQLPKHIEKLGFEHHLCDVTEAVVKDDATSKSLLLALAVAGFAAANIMLMSVSVWSGAEPATAQLFHLISGLIAVPAVAFAGQPFFKSAIGALARKSLNMDVPISLAVLLALGLSLYESVTGGAEAYFDAAVTLLFFLLIGRYLDSVMRQKARGAVERLASLSAKNGVVISTNGEASYIALGDIKPGMVLRVYPGERFPVDGTIVAGNTNLDCSHVTGESEPIVARTGVSVEAGTLNLSSVVDFESVSDASGSFLGEMHKMIAEAENGRGNYIRIADRMAQIYAPAVHILALLAFIGWMVFTGGDWHTSIYVAISVLIVTCPCALGLAVPVAHVIGANRLMQNGILMRDGTALERLSEIDAVSFDKTGTLTTGSPSVQSSYNLSEDDLPYMLCLAHSSSHPYSKALRSHFSEVEPARLVQMEETPGFGIEGVYEDKRMRLGRQEWVSEIAQANSDCDVQFSLAFAIKGGSVAGFEVADALRPGARQAIRDLAEQNLALEIISGDQPARVKAIATELGIDNFHARQTPADKINRITAAKNSGSKVLMVGDGVNDAPALATGHVSMTPASASDVGRQAADFVFVRMSLDAVPKAHGIAKFTAKVVKQNFGLAIAYNCIAVPLAMTGFVTPLFAAIAMSASSIVVIANSFRISFAAGVDSQAEIRNSVSVNADLARGVS